MSASIRADGSDCMNSFELNKIMGAVFGALMLALGLNILSGILFTPKKPAVPGYDLPVAEAATGGGGGAPAAAAEPLPVLLAKADVARGTAAAKKCASCHTFEKGQPNRVGPNLYSVVEGPKAHIEGFAYSAALKGRGNEKWGYAELDKFLENPRGYLQGTSMAFAGIKAPQERADIIAYLRSLSDSPPPLPAP
jgi:cytochrome c